MEIHLTPDELESIAHKIQAFCDNTQSSMVELDYYLNDVLGREKSARLQRAFEEYKMLQKQMGLYLTSLEEIRRGLVAMSEANRAANQ